MKKFLLAIVAILALASAVALWARPASITCPQDGQMMFFDHMVFGQVNYCWYSHTGFNGSKHEAYIPCE